jgi:hypothetical protein
MALPGITLTFQTSAGEPFTNLVMLRVVVLDLCYALYDAMRPIPPRLTDSLGHIYAWEFG